MTTGSEIATTAWFQENDPHARFVALREHLGEQVLGQPELIERLLVTLLADGHMLIEGAPGLAKTTAVKALAESIAATDHRVQFTPDLLPGDVTGTDVFEPETSRFRFEPGPIFHNLVLADEINRAPAKVQSALLEAMAERQVTVGRNSHALPDLFMVVATQNPIEQEGTYSLPEAQLDRFLMYVRVEPPSAEIEHAVLRLVGARESGSSDFKPVEQSVVMQGRPIDPSVIMQARAALRDVHVAPMLEEYIVQLVVATRDPSPFSDQLSKYVEWGASTRGTIALDRCSRARAWLEGRDYVTPEDVHAIAPDVLRHRVLLSYAARADGVSPDDYVNELLRAVPLP